MTKNHRNVTLIFSCLILTLFTFCSDRKSRLAEAIKPDENNTNGYAKRFSLEKRNGYSQLTIFNPWQGAQAVIQKWYMISEGDQIPDGINPEEVITVPVRKVVCMSTTQLAMISALHEYNSVMGFSGTDFIYDPEFVKMVQAGLISDVGYEDNLNKEMILKIFPDIIIAYGVGAESSGYIAKLKELGIKVMFDADYLEEEPLGKSEWIRVFGSLYAKDHIADSIFSSVVTRYKSVKRTVTVDQKHKPGVLLGLPFRDTWYISPGNSYISKLIDDAGGKYLWSDKQSSVSMPVSIESVYLRALKADCWLNIGTVSSKSEIMAIDSRLESIPAFRKNHLYNNNKRINANGGNDYWESGSLNPDIILNDIASILHPELFPGRDLFYYRKIN